MTNKLFRTLKITCLCMALTAALPIVSFADEQTAVNENKKVVTIIHLDENGNPLEEDKQTERQRVLKRIPIQLPKRKTQTILQLTVQRQKKQMRKMQMTRKY